MKTFDRIDRIPPDAGPVRLAVGAFDGVHRGHRAVILSAVAAAATDGGRSGVLTLDPDPAAIVRPDRAPSVLTPTPRKLELFEALGIEICVVLRFTRELAATAPGEFAREILLGPGRVGGIFVGGDFRYGRNAEGDVASLREECVRAGAELTLVPGVDGNGGTISASRIRELVASGHLDEAALLLGRPFSIWGEVVRGRGEGTRLGIPTANLEATGLALPPHGVYATATRVHRDWYGGAANVGIRPTIGDRGRGNPLVETHLEGFSGDLVDTAIEVVFGPRIRHEQEFADKGEMTDRIRGDLAEAAGWWRRERHRFGRAGTGSAASEVYTGLPGG